MSDGVGSGSQSSAMRGKGKSPETHNAFGAPSSLTSKLLAAYDAGRMEEPETYFEVPSSHFLARPSGPIASGVASSSSIALPSVASSTSFGPVWRQRQDSTLLDGSSSSGGQASFVTVQEQISGHVPLSDVEHRSTTSASLEETQDALHGLSTSLRTFSSLPTQPAANLFGGQQQRRPHMPDTTTLASADFDIDVRSGFLPPEEPVKRLQGIEEEVWECALDRAQRLPLRIGGGGVLVTRAERRLAYEWRRNVRQMLVLHPSPQILTDIRFARRAHLVLSFLAHFYMHSQPKPFSTAVASPAASSLYFDDSQDAIDEASGKFSGVVPASIAVPWIAISHNIDLPPVLTYATTVMWNWHLRDAQAGFHDDNLTMSTTFSGTESEHHFYKTSLLTETYGVKALTLMRRMLDEAFVGDTLAIRRIRYYLRKLAKVIGRLQRIIYDIRAGCDPQTFYWGIRPWFNGCDSYVDSVTGEKGWIFDGVEEFGGQRMLFLGPSAGQSSLIHAIDVFLGVDHSAHASRATSIERENGTFMERMQVYMPGPHRTFLTHLRSVSFVEGADDDAEEERMQVDEESVEETSTDRSAPRERHPLRALLQLTEQQQSDVSSSGVARRTAVDELRAAYNGAVNALKHMRDEHMRIATLYIISQLRTAPPPEYSQLNETLISTGTSSKDTDGRRQGSAKGTGGTDLVSFLRACRVNTVNTLVTNDVDAS